MTLHEVWNRFVYTRLNRTCADLCHSKFHTDHQLLRKIYTPIASFQLIRLDLSSSHVGTVPNRRRHETIVDGGVWRIHSGRCVHPRWPSSLEGLRRTLVPVLSSRNTVLHRELDAALTDSDSSLPRRRERSLSLVAFMTISRRGIYRAHKMSSLSICSESASRMRTGKSGKSGDRW